MFGILQANMRAFYKQPYGNDFDRPQRHHVLDRHLLYGRPAPHRHLRRQTLDRDPRHQRWHLLSLLHALLTPAEKCSLRDQELHQVNTQEGGRGQY